MTNDNKLIILQNLIGAKRTFIEDCVDDGLEPEDIADKLNDFDLMIANCCVDFSYDFAKKNREKLKDNAEIKTVKPSGEGKSVMTKFITFLAGNPELRDAYEKFLKEFKEKENE